MRLVVAVLQGADAHTFAASGGMDELAAADEDADVRQSVLICALKKDQVACLESPRFYGDPAGKLCAGHAWKKDPPFCADRLHQARAVETRLRGAAAKAIGDAAVGE